MNLPENFGQAIDTEIQKREADKPKLHLHPNCKPIITFDGKPLDVAVYEITFEVCPVHRLPMPCIKCEYPNDFRNFL